MNNYLDFLKNHETFDKFILFMLSLKDDTGKALYNVEAVAKHCQVTRQSVYNIIARNQAVYDQLIKS